MQIGAPGKSCFRNLEHKKDNSFLKYKKDENGRLDKRSRKIPFIILL
jgi:hypothetical protein